MPEQPKTQKNMQAPPPQIGMLQILGGAQVAGAVSCLAQMGIPDLLESGPKSAEELAKEIGAQPQALYRLMRATACVGVLAEGPDGKFSQTPMSAVLRSKANPSLRALAIMGGREWHGRAWSNLDYCVRTGKQAMEHIYGASIFEFMKQNPQEAQIFNDTMTNLSMIDGPAVAEAYDFHGINSIVDVGGGHGLLLAIILQKHPNMKGTLYDMPHVVNGAADGPLKPVLESLYDRIGRHVFVGSTRRRCLHHETHYSRLAGRSVRQDTQSMPQRRESGRQTACGGLRNSARQRVLFR